MALSEETRNDPADLSGAQKAAVLLTALREETAAAVLKRLQRASMEEITREIANLDRITPEMREVVVREFYHLILARHYVNMGGLPLARALLQKTLTPEDAKHAVRALEQQVHSEPFSFLQGTETESLSTFLQGEHPQTIALVLSHLAPTMSAEILNGLDPERQVEVVTRVANMDQTSPDVIREVERGLESRLAGLVSERFERAGGARAVAEMLNLAGRATEKTILEGLSESDPELVDDIRRLMFVFEDILRVDDRGIQAVLKEVENEELALALKTASDELREKIFSNMSERAANLIREEMEYMGPVRVSDVEVAQQKVVDIVRRLEDAGEVVISGKGRENELII